LSKNEPRVLIKKSVAVEAVANCLPHCARIGHLWIWALISSGNTVE